YRRPRDLGRHDGGSRTGSSPRSQPRPRGLPAPSPQISLKGLPTTILQNGFTCNYISATDLPVKTGSEFKLERTSQKRTANEAGSGSGSEGACQKGRRDMVQFVPFRLNLHGFEVSKTLS